MYFYVAIKLLFETLFIVAFISLQICRQHKVSCHVIYVYFI